MTFAPVAPVQRRRPIGAEVRANGVHFRVWAPAHDEVAVVIDGHDFPLEREEPGYFSGLVNGARAGTRYKLRVGDGVYPDPASRFQPEGVHGPSEVIDPTFAWRDWRGVALKDAVLYEMHVGTFTPEGTYAAAIGHMDALASLGITVLELMPVNEFPGRFGWGYDGVALWAPTRLYGRPEDLRRSVIDGRRSAGGRPRTTSRPSTSSVPCRITTRSRTPRPARGSTSSPRPAAFAR